ncbi:hypothetical protein OSB04_017084 [Centaurea solstitialis]|uniref:Uncharacterized protein n=1 Tax=Centaurea solstitialis TaxID=347529 RepID=A0AA38WKE0_9ASTR|nr:hypothetical protein OSB04_017084 [Centaurea solstitialis]
MYFFVVPQLNKYVLCKVYKNKKETSKNTDNDNQTQEIQNEGNQEEVERGSPSVPVNHGSILDQGIMNTTHHQNPIVQPGSSSIQPAGSEEDPNYQRVPLSPSPVGISRDDHRSQFQNTSHHPILQPGVTSTKSASEEDPYRGFMRREVETCFVAAPPLPSDYINNYTTVVLSPSPSLPTEFQNQSGSNDRQSVLTQDATNDHIPQPCWPCDYNATNTQDALDHVPQPCDYDQGGLMSLDRMEHFTLDGLDWSHNIISEIDRNANDAATFAFYLLTNSLDH